MMVPCFICFQVLRYAHFLLLKPFALPFAVNEVKAEPSGRESAFIGVLLPVFQLLFPRLL
jgi:hypothetical protein